MVDTPSTYYPVVVRDDMEAGVGQWHISEGGGTTISDTVEKWRGSKSVKHTRTWGTGNQTITFSNWPWAPIDFTGGPGDPNGLTFSMKVLISPGLEGAQARLGNWHEIVGVDPPGGQGKYGPWYPLSSKSWQTIKVTHPREVVDDILFPVVQINHPDAPGTSQSVWIDQWSQGKIRSYPGSVLWALGDQLGSVLSSPRWTDPASPFKAAAAWFNQPTDLNWMFGYTFNDDIAKKIYAEDKAGQLIIWLADAPAGYATSSQFLNTDLPQLIDIHAGNGPEEGPLYVVVYTELQNYGGYTQADLVSAYITAAGKIRDAYNQAYVGLGLGGFSWSNATPTVDLSVYEPAIKISDFVAVQHMHDAASTVNGENIIIPQMRLSSAQLASYKLPLMFSHCKIFGTAQEQAFTDFVNTMFTDAELATLLSRNLFAWNWMHGEYILDQDNSNKATIDEAYSFMRSYDLLNPVFAAWFRPPTFNLPHDETGQDRLWSRVSYPRGRTVLNPEPTTGQPTPYPGREEVNVNEVAQVEASGGRAYIGGGIYELTPGEKAVLEAAGYGAHITGVGP